MKFPVTLRHRDVKAKIHAKSEAAPRCKVAWKDSSRRRQIRTFAKYAKARAHAESVVREVSQGNGASSPSPRQVTELLQAEGLLRELARTPLLLTFLYQARQ